MAEFRDTIDGNVEGLLPNRLTVIRDTRFPETAMSLRGRMRKARSTHRVSPKLESAVHQEHQ